MKFLNISYTVYRYRCIKVFRGRCTNTSTEPPCVHSSRGAFTEALRLHGWLNGVRWRTSFPSFDHWQTHTHTHTRVHAHTHTYKVFLPLSTVKHGDDDIAIQPLALAALSLRGYRTIHRDKVRRPIAPIARRLSDRMAFRSHRYRHRFSFPSCSVESHLSSIVRSMGKNNGTRREHRGYS